MSKFKVIINFICQSILFSFLGNNWNLATSDSIFNLDRVIDRKKMRFPRFT